MTTSITVTIGDVMVSLETDSDPVSFDVLESHLSRVGAEAAKQYLAMPDAVEATDDAGQI